MTTHSDAFEPLKALEVTLYHGTRQSRAAAILSDGLRPTPIAALIAAVAQEYHLPVPAMQQYLSDKSRFSSLDSERAQTISTTADFDRAARWAQRAPEAQWDALRAVFVHAHPHLGDDDALSEAADFWVMAQRTDDPPVVIELRTALGALHSHGFSAGEAAVDTILREYARTSETLDPAQALKRAVEEFFRFLFKKTPEWRIPITDASVVSVSAPMPFHVTAAQLAYLSGQSIIELGPPDERDRVWGPPSNIGGPGGQWWPFDRVWRLLPPHRRDQLQEFSGRTIQPTSDSQNRT